MKTPASALLCLRRGGLGDTLLMIPVLRAMRAAHPAAELHFAGVREHAVLLQHYGIVDRVRSSEDFALWALATEGPRAAAARAQLARFAWIVADEPIALELPDVRLQHLDPTPREGDGPAAAQLLARLGPTAGPPVDPDPALRRVRAPVDRPPRAVLHPGSGGARKCWPWERWMELAADLVRDGVPVTVALGEAEHAHAAAPLPRGVARFAGRPVVALATLLESAAVFAGNDAGVTHLAAALRVPTVAVFGPTDARVWAPPHAHVTVVGTRTEGAPAAAVAEVRRALDAALRAQK